MNEVIKFAQKSGAQKIEIGVIDAHKTLKQFYIKHGFYEVAKREYGHLPFIACEMELKV